MAIVYVTLKIMPDSGRYSNWLLISDFGGNVGNVVEEPVAFGLKSLNITFSMDESKGDTEPLEENITNLEQVQSVQVTDVRRAIG